MLHDVARSLDAGGYTFPTREDYLVHGGEARSADQLGSNEIIAIQRDWHMRGQNGCIFAMHAARNLTAGQWRYHVCYGDPDVDQLQRTIVDAVSDPDNQILSLIFPCITCADGIQALVAAAVEIGCYQADDVDDESGLVALRYPIGSAESWIVGFAPLASTKQATR